MIVTLRIQHFGEIGLEQFIGGGISRIDPAVDTAETCHIERKQCRIERGGLIRTLRTDPPMIDTRIKGHIRTSQCLTGSTTIECKGQIQRFARIITEEPLEVGIRITQFLRIMQTCQRQR